jgi:hypothetical protein
MGYGGQALVPIGRLLVVVSTLRWAKVLVRDTCIHGAVIRIRGLVVSLLPNTRVLLAGTAGWSGQWVR